MKVYPMAPPDTISFTLRLHKGKLRAKITT